MKLKSLNAAKRAKLCSACLLGINCKYDGKNNADKKVIALLKKEVLVPVCPEQLGGLTTPRERTELKGKQVITLSGKDVTNNFHRGAIEVLKIAKLLNIKEAMLKQRSPSCGSGQVKTFSGQIIRRDGITSGLLKKNGIKVISEEDL